MCGLRRGSSVSRAIDNTGTARRLPKQEFRCGHSGSRPPIGHDGSHTREKHAAGTGGETPQPRARISLPPAPPRPSWLARPCLLAAAQDHSGARLFLASSSRLPLCEHAPFQRGVLGQEVRGKPGAGSSNHLKVSRDGVGCPGRLGMRDS